MTFLLLGDVWKKKFVEKKTTNLTHPQNSSTLLQLTSAIVQHVVRQLARMVESADGQKVANIHKIPTI